MVINEATLEARLNGVLTTVFPTFKDVKLEHQKSLSIRFGHHDVLVDLDEPSARPTKAILDILLTIEGTNVMLLELKREGLALKPDDVEQGISYARLTHPIPPLTLISNGVVNQFYNSYTKEPIDKESVDIGFLRELINNSFQLAVNDFKEAVQLLLNTDPKLFSKVINQLSEKKFARYMGAVGDFSKPVSPDVQITRKVVGHIETLFAEGEALVAVVGSAFSGKTNILYQFFNKSKALKSFALYIDCKDFNYSILQELANSFSKSTKVPVDPDKIREWLINSMSHLPDSKFHLLLDNFNDDLSEDIKKEVSELIDIFNGVNQHTLYTTDEINLKKVAFQKNRNLRTVIGDKSKLVELDELDDDEYGMATTLLWEKFRVRIEHGGYHTPEYREPRVIRLIASIFKNKVDNENVAVINAVPDLSFLKEIAGSDIYTLGVHELYEKLVACFFAEQALREAKADLTIMAFGSGAITEETFKAKFPDDFENLLSNALVVVRYTEDKKRVIYPKIKDLFAFHSIEAIANLILGEYRKETAVVDICKMIMKAAAPVPYCDIIVTGALLKVADKNESRLYLELIQELLKYPPGVARIEKGTEMLSYAEDAGHIRFKFDTDVEDGGVVSNFLPYSVLSQLSAYPILVGEETVEESPYDFFLSLLYDVGSYPNFLGRIATRSIKNMRPHHAYNWEGVGYFVSTAEGIIEPIVESIKHCFFIIPHEIERLYDYAFEQDNFILLNRMYLALRTLTGHYNKALAGKANDVVNRFLPYFHGFFANYVTRDIKDPEEREIMRKKILSSKGDEVSSD